MFPSGMSVATMISWPWILLGIMAISVISVIGYDVRVDRLGRQWRRARTLHVETLSQAFGFAQDVLTLSRPARDLWHEAAVLPLTALVYTAARQGDQLPWLWLAQTVEMLSSGEPDAAWREVTSAVGHVDDQLCRWVSRTADLDARQRASVAAAMRDAIAPYTPGVNR